MLIQRIQNAVLATTNASLEKATAILTMTVKETWFVEQITAVVDTCLLGIVARKLEQLLSYVTLISCFEIHANLLVLNYYMYNIFVGQFTS